MTELDLRESLERQLDAVPVPPPPLGAVVAKGRRRGRRRRTLAVSSLAAVTAVVAATGATVVLGSDGGHGVDRGDAFVGALDFSHGARAYAAPGAELHLGGRTFPHGDLADLDTDAVATAYGVVFYDRGRPMLLGTDGEVRALVDGPVDDPDGFHPTAKADSVHPWVAYATRRGTSVTVTVHDLAADRDVASTTIDGVIGVDVDIDAFDNGVVYLRTAQLTRSWDISTGEGRTVYDGGGRVVDVRGGVMLYDGKPPADLGLTRVRAPADAQLTFDGRYVLDWSSRLRSTDGSPDLVLDQGPTDQSLGFWAIDSDGSVLVARPDGDYPRFRVYDCEVPTGSCDELGSLVTDSGDPEFIGVDG